MLAGLMRLLSALLALIMGPAQPALAKPVIPWGAINIIQCGNAVGTAFHIGDGRYITAAHVVSHGDCAIGGFPVRLVHQDGKLDTAELIGAVAPEKFEIDCSGFRPNQHYLAIGYAGGVVRLDLPLIYSAFGRDPEGTNGMFVGPDSQPGMSGGPLINEDYQVSGIVQQRWPSRARALADTYLCGRV